MTELNLLESGISGTVLCEPLPKNTAAAIMYAAVYIKKAFEDAVMIVLPSDHYITDSEKYIETLTGAVDEAANDSLITIGIKPTYPETGYGYIKALEEETGAIRKVERFVEKPDYDTAKTYCESGKYFWNSGIFVWKTSTVSTAIKEYLPEMFFSFEQLASCSTEDVASNSEEMLKLKTELFTSLKSISIDYGIMELAKNRIVIPAEFGWHDLGSWQSIDAILACDSNENRTPQTDKAIFLNSHNCSAFSENSRISLVGVENIIAVQAGNDILIINKQNSQDVRKIVEMINNSKP
jgi:mannose-1-phosphate guanylyltransferase